MNNRGFTLIEMMVVVVLIGIVATVVAVNVADKPGTARARLTAAQIKILKGDMELFKADHNRYPETLQELVPRYRDELPKDGWERPYVYRVPGLRGPYDIVSLGEDGKEGGEGLNADLWSHPPK